MNIQPFKNYRVRLTETVIMEASVVVRARSQEEATAIAERAVFQGEADEPTFTRVNALDTNAHVEGETDEAAAYDADDFPSLEEDVTHSGD